MLNETHDPRLRSWLDSAHDPDTDFPLQNLPFGVFRHLGSNEPFRAGVAIGDQILDLNAVALSASSAAAAVGAAAVAPLNAFMAQEPRIWSALRLALSRALRLGSPDEHALRSCLLPQAAAQYAVPADIGDYTDFYSSIHHATSVGRLFRPDQPLMPNYRWLPVAYHGRSSSIGVSGQRISRPCGQAVRSGASTPSVGPSARLDYELELGAFIGPGNALGQRIAVDAADEHLFGLVLLNDWSARDIQAWESQPLGPFQGKNFATTISPWVVTLEALAPFRTAWQRPPEDPPLLTYLDDARVRASGAFDIELEVLLQSERMRSQGVTPQRLSHSNFKDAYWTLAQMVAHHSLNGCNLRAGDLLGTGTLSGPEPADAGSLLELTRGGREPLTLPDGELRRFLEDGDTVTMRAWCAHPDRPRLGFGALTGTVTGAQPC